MQLLYRQRLPHKNIVPSLSQKITINYITANKTEMSLVNLGTCISMGSNDHVKNFPPNTANKKNYELHIGIFFGFISAYTLVCMYIFILCFAVQSI